MKNNDHQPDQAADTLKWSEEELKKYAKEKSIDIEKSDLLAVARMVSLSIEKARERPQL